MPNPPRDYADLFLAPVALEIDQRLEDLAGLDRDALHQRVVLATNSEARDRAGRAHDVVGSLTHVLDLHGWTAGWDDRGIRLAHHTHTLVLGVPRNVVAYVEELPAG
ncbi:hypothetical protein [Petropleomorpha daqingensis]|uniref:Uncharacterized protein n=1 Tax=Petropleomorpha daqingensis TaxID=2026353 RepID=A0A853C990_9ACTN|nr:hypothetical protein [Petropleomorpha daqingensis]NYJ03749.1 hypothetical protein [Petropleomorpha daqingensis]